MRELARAGLGEEDAVVGTQLAGLALEVGTPLHEAAAFVDKAIPDIDIGDAGLAGPVAVQGIQEQQVGRSLLPADSRQADPQHRYALGFQHANQFFDLLGVKFDPSLIAKLIEPAARARALFGGCALRRIIVLGIVSLRGIRLGISLGGVCLGSVSLASIGLGSISRAFGLGLCVRRLGGVRLAARVLLVFLLVGLLLGDRLADRPALVEAEHDAAGVRLFPGGH